MSNRYYDAKCSRVASIREVDWQSMRPNFYVIFPAGVLENAPHTFAFFTRARDTRQLAGLLRGVAKQHPQVTAIDLSMIAESRTSRAMGPAWSSDDAKATMPQREQRP